MRRSQHMLQLALLGQEAEQSRFECHSIVKLLEQDKLIVVKKRDIHESQDRFTHYIEFEGRHHSVIIVLSGEKCDMETIIGQLTHYEAMQNMYKNTNKLCSATQTETTVQEKQTQTDYLCEVPSTSRQSQLVTLDSTIQSDDNYRHFIDDPEPEIEIKKTLEESQNTLMDMPSSEKSNIGEDPEKEIEIRSAPEKSQVMPRDFPLPEKSNTDKGSAVHSLYKRKIQYCIFCKKDITNLSRHLIQKHPEEERVLAFSSLPKTDATRRLAIAKLRIEGYKQKCPSGVKINVRGKVNYIPCEGCGGLYGENTLYRHYNVCTGKKPPRNLKKIATAKGKDYSQSMCDILKNDIIPGMSSSEEILEIISKDEDIIRFGNGLCLRFGGDISKQKNLIRTKLIQIAKIKLFMSNVDPGIKTVADVFNPERWSIFIEAVKEYAHLNEMNSEKQSPTNVQHIGLLFINLAKDIKAECHITEEGRSKREIIQLWIELYERKYKNTIGWQATKLAAKKRWQLKEYIPLASDIMLLNKYLKSNFETSYNKLKQGFNQNAWEELNKASMLLLLTFNRKRIGELMTITVEDFQKKEKIKKDTDIYSGLTETEKLIADKYYHMTIRGKLTRPVPLLVSNDIAEAINILLRYRLKAGVTEDNKHLFAKRNGCFDANLVFREASYSCGAKAPQDITSTALRKHIATVSQALNLSDSDLKVLCGFLGHTKQTHLENYRMPSDAVHTAKLSRLLNAFDEGKIHKFKGKSIDDIDVELPIEVDEGPFSAQQTVNKPGIIPEPTTTPSSLLQVRPSTSRDVYQYSYAENETTPTKKPPDSDKDYTPSPITPTPPKKRVRWSTPEKLAMNRAFSIHLANRTLPSLKECHAERKKVSVLRQRQVQVMKTWVSNQFKKKEKIVKK